MLSDKEIALRLLDMIEELFIQKAAREAVLDALNGHGSWEIHTQRLEQNPAHKAVMHARIEPLRELVLSAPDLNSIVREMLEGLERIDEED